MAITRVSGSRFTNLQKFDNFATDFGAVTGNYVALQTYTVDSGGATSITFSSIPQNYTHLQIRAFSIASTGGTSAQIEFNGVTQPNSAYYTHYVRGSGSAAQAGATASQSNFPDFQGGSTSPGAAILDILDYSSTTKYKTSRQISGYDANGSGYIALTSNLWQSTAAITSITIRYTTISQYTSFALYGIAG